MQKSPPHSSRAAEVGDRPPPIGSTPKPSEVEDIQACEALLRAGSRSFFVASRLLPPRLRSDVAAVYGFCRVSDDAIDLSERPADELKVLHARLEAIYAERPDDHPVDRCLTRVVQRRGLPRVAFEGLLEGFAWDAEGRSYDTIESLEAYCVRVASTVGVLMTVLMGQRTPWVLARACDLGLAMQLTNISRDVGEDLRAGRVYLPTSWLEEAGLSKKELLASPKHSPALASVIRRLLNLARIYYRRAEAGIAHLPWDCRYSIDAALAIYEDIERGIRQHDYDSVSRRSYTSVPRKAVLLGRAAGNTSRRFPLLKLPPQTDWPVASAAEFLVSGSVAETSQREPADSQSSTEPSGPVDSAVPTHP